MPELLKDQTAQTCSSGGGTGCCSEGRHGLLCESCTEGFTKQTDQCIQCAGSNAVTILKKSAQKAFMIMLVCAKLIDKASSRTYTATTAFATIVFTMQTIALAAQDSLGGIIRQDFPRVQEWMQFFQGALNPDQETPEKCAATPFNFLSVDVLLAFGWSCLDLTALRPCTLPPAGSRTPVYSAIARL